MNMSEARELGLRGYVVNIYFAMKYLASKYPWQGSLRELADETLISKDTVKRCLEKLIKKGLLLYDKSVGYSLSQKCIEMSQKYSSLSQKDTPLSQMAPNLKESSKENINKLEINNKQTNEEVKGVLIGEIIFSYDFLQFWENFDPDQQFDNVKKKCYDYWRNNMDEYARELAVANANLHDPGTNPYFWLTNQRYYNPGPKFMKKLEAGAGRVEEVTEAPRVPHWLTGQEQDENRRLGIPMMCCRNPETRKFGVLTKEEQEYFGYELAENPER